jgi:hypothetical protein
VIVQPFLAPLLWAFFFALPCALAGFLAATLSAPKLRAPVGPGRRWALAARTAGFSLLAVMAFAVLLVGCVVLPMHLGL